MKKVILLISACLLSIGHTFAQSKQVTIKAGTIVPMQSVNTVLARDVEEGQTVDFRVSQDIYVNDCCAIPRGTLVKGKVTEARKSSLAGTKGRLGINISGLTLANGDQIFFSNTDVRLSGKNRTPLAVITGLLLWPCIFIPGTKAVMPAGYEVQGTVASTVNVTTE